VKGVRWIRSEVFWGIIIGVVVLGLMIGIPILFAIKSNRLQNTILAPETEDYTAIDAYNPAGYKEQEQVQRVLTALQEAGLFGRHPLTPIIGKSGLKGEFQAHFLSGTSGEISTYYQLVFAWRAKDKSFVSTLPYEKVVFREIPQGEAPYIRFKFDGERLIAAFKKSNSTALYNLNFFIDEDVVTYATIHISKEDKESNLYFLVR